jgi:gas vesicle protein
MVGRARTAMKFFVYGLAVGLLFAPSSGAETRKRLLAWAGSTVQELLGIAGEDT